jgi:predicted phosphodiesterase
MGGKTQKFVAFGCSHHPLHDPSATAWVVETVAKERPDVVAFLGDGLEANAASQWDDAKELAIALGDEYESLNAFLADLRKAAPKARRIYRAGNHEDNIVRAGRLDPRIRGLCDWRNPRNLPELSGWNASASYNYSRRHGCTWLGPQICLAHGFETTNANCEVEAMYFLRNSPYSLYACAHTHRPTPVTPIVWKSLPMDRWHANVGCLRNLEPGYMERKRKWAWGHAMLVGEYKPLKSPRMCREWDAEVRVLRMYDGEAA